MEKKLILAGSGGCMRELLWQIQELNRRQSTWEVLGYIDISAADNPLQVGGQSYAYLGNDTYLLNRQEETQVAICVGSSRLRRRIAEKLSENPWLQFPNLILANTCICPDVQMGRGNIISMDCRISTHVAMGDFNFLNMGAAVCHDGVLADYVTMSPDARLAGNVTVGSSSEIGMGTRVIQGIRIGSSVVTGAGSVVIRDIPDGVVAVGVPARAASKTSARTEEEPEASVREAEE
ncbi:MAG: transferase [Lachnospiraceae bacterium]|nr:transferase [Lachnospiraceae bacterium]